MQNWKIINFLKKNNIVIIPIATLFLSLAFFICAYFFAGTFARLMSLDKYLMWHNMLELGGTVVCFAIFLTAYHTYSRTKGLRLILLGSFLLSVGLLEIFHTLSFKGMPYFLAENLQSNRATTLWIISRLMASIGFFVISFIDLEKKSTIHKQTIMLAAIIIAVSALIITTYYPGFIPQMYIDGVGLTPVKKLLEFFVAIVFLIAIVRFFKEYLQRNDPLLPLLCTALILNIFSELSFICYNQVYDVFNYIGHIYKAISYVFIFKVVFVRNVQLPYLKLTDAQKELKDYVDNLDRIVEHRTRQLKHMNRKLMEDLEYARDIQKAMLPTVLPDVKGLSFSTFYYPAERLSGDFYDIYRIDDRNIGMYICDVSGHGVPAAMLTVFLKQCIENRLETDLINGRVSVPSEMLQSVYDSFNNTNFKDDVYIVLVYAILDTATFEMTYSSAGMNVAPLIIKKDGNAEEITIQGFPICKFKGIYDVQYKDTVMKLDKGDRILFYTDGLVEVENISGDQFSEGRLASILNENSSENGDGLSAIIYEKLFKFIDNCKIKDDITFFIMDIAV